jgi:curli biogenesis system outer membrane secretion channel CsgG
LRENGARKIKMRKELEEDSEESMDQMVFGGIRKHLMKERNDGFDVSFFGFF